MPTDHEYDYRKDEFLTDAQKELIKQTKRNVARELTSPVPVEQSDATMEDTLRDCAERLAELTEVKAENDALQGEVKRLRAALESALDLVDTPFVGRGNTSTLHEVENKLRAALRGEEQS